MGMGVSNLACRLELSSHQPLCLSALEAAAAAPGKGDLSTFPPAFRVFSLGVAGWERSWLWCDQGWGLVI